MPRWLAVLFAAVVVTADTSASSTPPSVCLPAVDARAQYVALNLESDREAVWHGGGLNKCGCHFNRKTGECHCHQARGCGCSCQPAACK